METAAYRSPLGSLKLAADGQGLAGVWFEGQKHYGELGSAHKRIPEAAASSAAPPKPNAYAALQTAAYALGNADHAMTRIDVGAPSEPDRAAALHVLDATCLWLDAYFAGEQPRELSPLHFMGTPFQQRVWRLLLEIPYGRTTTYGKLARRYEEVFGVRTAARAIGGAVGRNPLSLVVPCHRVVGANGSLTGYAGGVERKRALLELERKPLA